MKDIFKVISTGITGIFSGLYAGVDQVRTSVIRTMCSDITALAETASILIALITAVLSLFYVYYKVKMIKREYDREEI